MYFLARATTYKKTSWGTFVQHLSRTWETQQNGYLGTSIMSVIIIKRKVVVSSKDDVIT
jgi:hypothetical protein